MEFFPADRLPLVPDAILRAHQAYCPNDSRFRSCARLLQALHRETAGWSIGTYETDTGRKVKKGNLVSSNDGADGANFLSADVHKLARRELAYREPGAVFGEKRVYTNLLSSTPLALNLLGPLKLDRDLAEAFIREIAPDLAGRVCAVSFEHSPGRGDPNFLNDGTAFDALFVVRQDDGKRVFVAVEMKYSESCYEPEARLRDRYDDLARSSGLFKDPEEPDLRRNPIQQLWRLHMLAQSMIDAGLYDAGRVVVIAPSLNDQVQRAIVRYETHLAPPQGGAATFLNLTLENAIGCLALAGAPDTARDLTRRYVNFQPVHALI